MDAKSKKPYPTVQAKLDKAATTTAAALGIIRREQSASSDKVARLRALRLAAQAEKLIVPLITPIQCG